MTNAQPFTSPVQPAPAEYNGLLSMKPAINDETRWRAVLERDRLADGRFVFGVLTTGVFCRPSCPARRPLRQNVRFFASPREAEQAGLRACLRCRPTVQSAGRSKLVRDLCRFIEANAEDRVTLRDLSKFAGLSRFHLQRLFTAELGISPAKYLQACRFSKFKRALRKQSVTDAWAEAGYSSASRVYETAHARLGMTPGRYRKGAPLEELRYTTFGTSLGSMVLAAGGTGVCEVQFAETQAAEKLLHSEYPGARITRDDAALASWAAQVRDLVAGEKPTHDIPLDIRGTAFQQKVWQQLRRIPAGQTRSYSQIARALHRPAAVRAVASACARNSLAVVVPCHRVVRKSGSAKGYRWGMERKERLLKTECKRTMLAAK